MSESKKEAKKKKPKFKNQFVWNSKKDGVGDPSKGGKVIQVEIKE